LSQFYSIAVHLVLAGVELKAGGIREIRQVATELELAVVTNSTRRWQTISAKGGS